MSKGIKAQYEKVRRKHALPAFSELDAEFEISRIEGEGFLLREVRKKILEKIHEAGSILEETLHPDTNLAGLCESRVFDEVEKQRLFEIYKRLMVAHRACDELSVLNDEKQDAGFIKSFFQEWKRLKPELARFVRQLKESWEKETEEGESAGYMG